MGLELLGNKGGITLIQVGLRHVARQIRVGILVILDLAFLYLPQDLMRSSDMGILTET